MRTILLLLVVLVGLGACSGSPKPFGRWALDRDAARSAFEVAYRNNPGAKKILDEIIAAGTPQAAAAVVDALEITYEILEDKTYSHTFKITKAVPPVMVPTEASQRGTWSTSGAELTLTPTEMNGVKGSAPEVKSLLTFDTMSYDFFGVGLTLRRL